MEYKITSVNGGRYLEVTQSYSDEFQLTINTGDNNEYIVLPKSSINDLISCLKQIEKSMKEDLRNV
tara:strand:+ start:16592 stop:16789 length:198 start_codon:yes stop_codon:yes gene_type:complete